MKILVEKEKKCSICNGTKKHWIPVYHNDSEEVDCDHCNKKGYVSVKATITIKDLKKLLGIG